MSFTSKLIDVLESRILFSQVSFPVLNTNDSGPGSFRQALLNAPATAPVNDAVIQFQIPGAGVHTIKPLSALPFITGQVNIIGQTDSAGDPETEIDGQYAGSYADGLFFQRDTPGNNVYFAIYCSHSRGSRLSPCLSFLSVA